MRGMAREYAAGNSLGPGWHESAGIFGCPVGGSVADGAVRPGAEDGAGLSIRLEIQEEAPAAILPPQV